MSDQSFNVVRESGLTSLRSPVRHVVGCELPVPADTEQLFIETGTLAATVFKSVRAPSLQQNDHLLETIAEAEESISLWPGDTLTPVRTNEFFTFNWQELQGRLAEQRSSLSIKTSTDVIEQYDHLIELCGRCTERVAISYFTIRLVGDPEVVEDVLNQLEEEFCSLSEEAQAKAADTLGWKRGSIEGASAAGYIPPESSMLPPVPDVDCWIVEVNSAPQDDEERE